MSTSAHHLDTAFQTRQTAIANEAYGEMKAQARKSAMPHSVTIRSVERKFKLKAGSLVSYRANHVHRKTTKSRDERGRG